MCKPPPSNKAAPPALRTELSSTEMLRCEGKNVCVKTPNPAALGYMEALAKCCVKCLSPALLQWEGRQIKNLLKKIFTIQHIVIKCVTKRGQVRCLAGIWVLHILVWILAPQTQSGFPKASSCCVFASGLDGSLGLWIAKIRSDAPIFVFNNRDKPCLL